MPQRNCSKEQQEVVKVSKRVMLPIDMAAYEEIAKDGVEFRAWLDRMIAAHPELFPAIIHDGYVLHDYLPESDKLPGVRFRRIKLKQCDEKGQDMVLTIASSGVLPYMVGYTDEVEKALFLRRFGVPFWGLSYVFGHNDAYWYRLTTSLGCYDLVSTTVKDPEHLPQHLLADEKHIHINGEKAYIAMTVGADCVLGAAVASTADEAALTDAYGRFRHEAQQLAPTYAPQTVNTDGWKATQNAWQTLFTSIVILECFLHAFLRIRDRCQKRYQDLFPTITSMVWDIYRSPSPKDFRQGVTAFLTWSQHSLTGTALEAIVKLAAKTDVFLLTFDFPDAHRTSNMIDRHMVPLDRWLMSARFFHGHYASAERQVRSWALLHNFWPYCPRAAASEHFLSPAHKLNGFVYHDNWLHNLLISSSCAGLPTLHRIHQN